MEDSIARSHHHHHHIIFLIIHHAMLYFISSVHGGGGGAGAAAEASLSRSQFPPGFLFGTSTSSYQIEGAFLEDGKSMSNWDAFSHLPGKIFNGDNGDTADDHYHRHLEDIHLMHTLRFESYRFSISWSRILPRGRFGAVNVAGVTFYNKIIDNLLSVGIEPFITINHNDVPQELVDRYGAWLSPQIQEDFLHLATTCFERFGDRVKYWATINEPNLVANMGYRRGLYPPGRCSPPFGNCSVGNSDAEPLLVVHNMLLSHARAAHVYRRLFPSRRDDGGGIGIIVSAFMYEALREDDEADQLAVARALSFSLGWVLDPLMVGDYPEGMRLMLGAELPAFSSEEKRLVAGTLDFVGLNHYSTLFVNDCTHSACPTSSNRPTTGFVHISSERDGVAIGDPTGIPDFFVVPRGMENIVDYVKNKYNNLPIFITENGYSSPGRPQDEAGGVMDDIDRVNFHSYYLSALLRAIRKGADVRGYFIWALMDNFEWEMGYKTKFGLVHVHRLTLQRTPKLSAIWYSSFIRNRSYSGDIISLPSVAAAVQ